jgi:hypothetical protein
MVMTAAKAQPSSGTAESQPQAVQDNPETRSEMKRKRLREQVLFVMFFMFKEFHFTYFAFLID